MQKVMRDVILVLAMGCVVGTQAQDVSKSSAVTAVAPRLSLAAANDIALTGFEQTFILAVTAMPANKYNFTPASMAIPGANLQGVRTFASEVRHVAQSTFITYSAVSGMTPSYDVEGMATLKTKSEIFAALAASFAFAYKALVTLTPETEQDPMDFQD